MKRTLLIGHDETVANFVADLCPLERPVWTPGYRAFGVLRGDGCLIAGVVFSDFRPQFSTLEMSAAGVSSCAFSSEIVIALGDYAFRQLSTYRLWARTAETNLRARRTLRGLGFVEEGVHAHHYGHGAHAVMCRLLKPKWETWLRHHQRETREAA